MEVINLESSEDEDCCVAAAAPLVKSSFVNQFNVDDDDDSSASSDDSIWNEKGLPSTTLKRKSAEISIAVDRPADDTKTSVGSELHQGAQQSSVKPNHSDTTVQNTTNKESGSTKHKYITQDSVEIIDDQEEEPLPPEVPLNKDGNWRIVLLMDHREFGCRNDNFLPTVEKNINNHFGGKYSEITTLPSADFLFVARLISKTTGEVMDERVLDLVIERKSVEDLSHCLIEDSKKYRPLSFFEAQMYKLRHCGIRKKLFLMEDDEDKAACFFVGVKTPVERDKSLKRVKTIRKQIENGEFPGVEVFCTRNKLDTIKFLIRQLESFQKSFNPRRPSTKTMEQLKLHINEQMKSPTFLEYLRLRKQPGIGDVKAMKVITDPSLEWDKTFVSPSSKKKTRATLEDKATFWNATSLQYIRHDNIKINISLSERERILKSQILPTWANTNIATSSKNSNPSVIRVEPITSASSQRPEISSTNTDPAAETCSSDECGICCKTIDIWADAGIISCNRVAACGATFHEKCLTSLHYDIHAQDGCIKCKVSSLFVTEQKATADAQTSELKSLTGSIGGRLKADADDYDDVIVID